jgi:hypothetical protein
MQYILETHQNMISVGDIVRMREPWLPYSSGSNSIGLVVEHMPPFAKTMEPHGLFMVMWSGELGDHLNHDDALSDDSWFDPDDLEVVLRSSQKHTD